jgi:acetyl esterase/lipase
LAQAFQHLWLVVYDDVYRAFTWVRHTIHPSPSPSLC